VVRFEAMAQMHKQYCRFIRLVGLFVISSEVAAAGCTTNQNDCSKNGSCVVGNGRMTATGGYGGNGADGNGADGTSTVSTGTGGAGGSSGCMMNCDDGDDCTDDQCMNGICQHKSKVGAECTKGTLCFDGVCCNKQCDEPCEVCNLPTLKGTCSVIPAGEQGKCTVGSACGYVSGFLGCKQNGVDINKTNGDQCSVSANCLSYNCFMQECRQQNGSVCDEDKDCAGKCDSTTSTCKGATGTSCTVDSQCGSGTCQQWISTCN
jgi:hypothetical protein